MPVKNSMADRKISQIDLMIECWVSLLADVAAQRGCVDTTNDVAYMRHRFVIEGTSFFTKTLPLLGKQLDASLSSDKPFAPIGFKRAKGGVLPRFLGFLWNDIFEAETGTCNTQDAARLNDVATCVKHARQLLYLFYKYELPYDDTTRDKAIAGFVAVEQELHKVDTREWYKCKTLAPILHVASKLIARVFANCSCTDLIPSHGPGAVATGEKPWEKMRFSRIYSMTEQVYPASEYFFLNPGHMASKEAMLGNFAISSEPQARVVLVPKDSRGPRIISCEPLELQWLQQGLKTKVVKTIESHRLTRGFVNFTDQSINRRLALEGSRAGRWVTLDMKDASDRVSYELVGALFERSHMFEYLTALRSVRTLLPDGTAVTLKKFAPMGSALCFPIEAITFWALAVACLHIHRKYSIAKATRRVYVYGDDMIVRAEDYGPILAHFPLVNLRFNESKCCTMGLFRESCGMDAFAGVDVTPVKIKRVMSSIRNPEWLPSWIAYSNALYMRGYWQVADYIRDRIDRAVPGIPVEAIEPPPGYEASYLRFLRMVPSEYSQSVLPQRYNHDLMRKEIYALCSVPKVVYRPMEPYDELFLSLVKLTSREGPPSGAGLDPGYYSLRRRVTLKRRWCPKAQ